MTAQAARDDMVFPAADVEATRRRLTARQAEVVANLVRAAEEETEEVGYAGLTVRGVARRAGVAPATAYTYFSSKDHLLAEVLWRRMEVLPPADTATGVPMPERVERTIRAMIPFAGESTDLIDACTIALISSDSSSGWTVLRSKTMRSFSMRAITGTPPEFSRKRSSKFAAERASVLSAIRYEGSC